MLLTDAQGQRRLSMLYIYIYICWQLAGAFIPIKQKKKWGAPKALDKKKDKNGKIKIGARKKNLRCVLAKMPLLFTPNVVKQTKKTVHRKTESEK